LTARIFCIETIPSYVRDGVIDGEATFWKESGSEEKRVIWAVRVYSMFEPVQGQDTIGMGVMYALSLSHSLSKMCLYFYFLYLDNL